MRHPVAQFALAGLAALAVFGVGSLLVLRGLGNGEALRDSRQFATLAGQGIVEPILRGGLLEGDRAALDAVDRAVQERVLGERVVRVKLWTTDGRIVYSDEPRQIGRRYPLEPEKADVLRSGGTRAALADLSGPENRFEQGLGRLYEVYLPIRMPDGTPLVFETYQREDAVTATGRRLWLPFAALLLASLVLLWLVQVPLAWRLDRRLRRTQEERETLLLQAVDASADERRRIAADLHDGPVQDLAGLSYSLSAAAARTDAPAEVRTAVGDAATQARDAMRRLRSVLVELHPPSLRASGLEAALRDLLAPLRARGLETELVVDPDLALDDEDERLVHRAVAEALRNVQRHARAHRVGIAVRADGGRAVLEVSDDGEGFATWERERRREDGHVGLSLLEELAERAGGRLTVSSAPGAGTVVTLELPGR